MRHSEFQGVPNTEASHHGPHTVSNSVVTLLSLIGGVHAKTNFVVVSVEGADVRMTINGTAPSSTVGVMLKADDIVILSRSEADTAKLIRVSSDATLQAMEYKA